MEKRRELCQLNQRIPALSLLAGWASLLSLPDAVIGRVNGLQQVAEDPDVPVLVRANEQRACRHIVKLVDAVTCAGAVQLTIETEPGS